MRVDEDVTTGGDSYYAAAKKNYPASVSGRLRTIKWSVLIITLGIYYFMPFIRWDRGPDAPGQAVLIDMAGRKAYFFGVEIWPQEVYYLTGLLVLASIALFLMNAVAGRVWCGYLCPQTVWTDLYFAVERVFQRFRPQLGQQGPVVILDQGVHDGLGMDHHLDALGRLGPVGAVGSSRGGESRPEAPGRRASSGQGEGRALPFFQGSP